MTRPYCAFALVLAAGLLGSAAARAEDFVPPPAIPGDGAAMATLARMPSSRLRLGGLDIVLEETPLATVQEMLSSGAIAERGDAAEHMSWLCYTYESEGTRQRLWIISSGEFGGAEHAADGIAAAVIAADGPAPESCPALPAGVPVWLDYKVWLGVSRDELIHRLGKPSQERGDILHFVYDGDVKHAAHRGGETDDVIVTSHLMVELNEGRIQRLWASKTTAD